ncbi:MAG: hypothetical protein PUB21_02720 [Bacteroidales bacterium]|nr:hypothetical protein [Bacteroidales bacterium]
MKIIYISHENTLGFRQLNIVSSSCDQKDVSVLYRSNRFNTSLLSWNRETREIYTIDTDEHLTGNEITLYSLPLEGGERKKITTVEADEVKMPLNGKYLFYIQRDVYHQIFRKNLQSGETIQLIQPKENFEIECWDVAADGSFLIFKTNEKQQANGTPATYLYKLSGDGSKQTRLANQHKDLPINYLAISPDQKMILTGSHNRVCLSNIKGQKSFCVKKFPTDFKIDNIFWWPDSKKICFECYDECFLHTMNLKGRKKTTSYPSIYSKCLVINT